MAVNTELTGQNIVGTQNDDNGEPGAEPALIGTIGNETITGLEGDDLLITSSPTP